MSNGSTFALSITGEGHNVAGYARQLSFEKVYTRSQLEEFVIADLRGTYQDLTEATVAGMNDEELGDYVPHLPELELDLTGEDEFLTSPSWDVTIG